MPAINCLPETLSVFIQHKQLFIPPMCCKLCVRIYVFFSPVTDLLWIKQKKLLHSLPDKTIAEQFVVNMVVEHKLYSDYCLQLCCILLLHCYRCFLVNQSFLINFSWKYFVNLYHLQRLNFKRKKTFLLTQYTFSDILSFQIHSKEILNLH